MNTPAIRKEIVPMFKKVLLLALCTAAMCAQAAELQSGAKVDRSWLIRFAGV